MAKEAANRFVLRMPPWLREKLDELAEANNRSLNSEIVDLLERMVSNERLLNSIVQNPKTREAEMLGFMRSTLREIAKFERNTQKMFREMQMELTKYERVVGERDRLREKVEDLHMDLARAREGFDD